MLGLEIRPIAKINHHRTENLPTDDKEGRRGGKHFFFRRDVIAVVKDRVIKSGNTVVRSFNRAMKLIAS